MICPRALFFAAICAFLFIGQHAFSQTAYPKIKPEDVTIVRDSFGIPHIFGKTDADVAYGLAWANAEDAFRISQDLIYAAKGYMGRKDGISGVKADFFVHAIGARELVNERFDTDLSPAFKKYIDGFVQGLNAYAKAHPDEVKVKAAFPVTAKDIVAAYVVMMSFLNYSQNSVGDAVGGKFDQVVVDFPTQITPPVGSNAFALNNTRTEDGKTYLCINPHLQMEGALSFYEAHLHSEEGLNMEGAMFQGSSSLAMGVNDSLGWGMTWNYFDKLDVYKLKMHPKKKLLYEFDGQWVALEKRPVWLKVNLSKKGKFVLPVKKMTYWSKYGCTVKSSKSESYYSIRFPGNMRIGAGEQLYKMNKARNYAEFWDALKVHSICLFNVVYADKDNNIFYLHHGMLPDRKDQSFNWNGMLPGNTSKDLWTGFVPIDQMQHVINPDCGYVFNTNNTPYNATCDGFNCPRTLPGYADERPGNNMRAERLLDYLNANPRFTFDKFRTMKFDASFPRTGKFIESMAPLFNLDEQKYPDLKEAIGILKSWNRITDVHEYAPTLIGMVMKPLFDKHDCGDDCFVAGVATDEKELVELLRAGCDTLRSYFGTIKVEWGTVNRNIRGDKDLPLRGFADVLSPCYPERVKGAGLKFKAKYGDTFTMLVSFDSKGVQRLEALQPQGNSSRPDSPHYNDQMELFSKQQARVISLKKEDVMKRAEKVYHPN